MCDKRTRIAMFAILATGAGAAVRAEPGTPAMTVREQRLPNGNSRLQLTDPRGKVQAVYDINLTTHHHPATTADDPAIRRWCSWKYGAFVCYNSNQFSGNENCAIRDPKIYCPTQLDVGQWVDTIKAAGMHYAVLTVRHTSGFLLWDSPTSVLDVANSGDTTDIVGAFVAACRRAGIAPGVYYCLWGGKKDPDANARAVILAQLHELATRYGPIPYFWLDMMNWAPEDLTAQEIYDLLKNIHPETVVLFNQHIQRGTEIRYFPTDVLNGEMMMPPVAGHQPLRGVGGATYYLPFEYEPCSQKRAGEGAWKSKSDYPAYVWFTYGARWGPRASRPFPARFLASRIIEAYHRGTSNVLLSCAPDDSGRFRAEDVEQLVALGKQIQQATRAVPVVPPPHGQAGAPSSR